MEFAFYVGKQPLNANRQTNMVCQMVVGGMKRTR